MNRSELFKIINAQAPIRVCDNGGWTDTWFAEYGTIFNIAVNPGAAVQIEVYERGSGDDQVVIHAENFGDRYPIDPTSSEWQKHPLLEAAVNLIGVPDNVRIVINIYSVAPPGASTGTSASVTVALIAALDRLTPGILSKHEIAYLAQRVETEKLGLQCGIQDQIAAAFGGISYIDMYAFPKCNVSRVQISDQTMLELEGRLVLIYLGSSHDSSQVHEMVIQDLESAGPGDARIEALRQTAAKSRAALVAGDFAALGAAMIENTNGQIGLHPDLLGRTAGDVIEIAKSYGVSGWKLNGAGGEGGSVTLLCGASRPGKREMIAAIEAFNPLFRSIPIVLNRDGVEVWEVA